MSILTDETDALAFGTPTGKKPLDEIEYRSRMMQRLNQLDLERELWRPHWRDLQRNILPEHGIALQGISQWEQVDGGKKRYWILDDAPSLAVGVFAAGMLSGLSSPSRPWFRLRLLDPDMNDWYPAKVWLAAVERCIYDILAKSNFYPSVHQGYQELGVFGTWAQFINEDDDTIVRCRPLTIGEYWLGMNNRLQVDTVYRRLWMNAAQIVEEFGEENVSTTVSNAYKCNQLATLFEVIQGIEPNDSRYNVPQCKGKAYRSGYFERSGEKKKMLRIRGFNDFPAQAPRWAVVGAKTYGTCPGMLCLANAKMLYKLTQKFLELLDKMVDPPLVAPTSMKTDTIFTVPGGLSYSDDLGQGNNGLRPLYQVPDVLDATQRKIDLVKEQIKEAFFNDLFMAISQEPTRSNVTAAEIAERHEEKLAVLGPIITSSTGELFSPSISRVINCAHRVKFLPPPPRAIAGLPLHIEYVSILAQAQKMVGISAVNQFVGFCAQLAQVFGPQVLDQVNADNVVLLYHEMTGVDPKTLNPNEVVSAIRQQRQKAQQQQQQLQAAGAAAGVAKTLGDASTQPGNALAELLGRLNPSPVPAES